MVGCLKTCGLLLCALITTLQVFCVASVDYECQVGAADQYKLPQNETCGTAFYELSFDFKGENDDGNELREYFDENINYDIVLYGRESEDSNEVFKIVPTKVIRGFPTSDKPLYFMAEHLDVERLGLTLSVQGSDPSEGRKLAFGDSYTFSIVNHLSGKIHLNEAEELIFGEKKFNVYEFYYHDKMMMSLDRPRYPRCVAFVTNSANPDVIYGGCIKELGFPFGSSVFHYKKSVRDISIVACREQCVIFPEFNKTQVTCPAPDNDPRNCQNSVIETAEKNPHFDMEKQPPPTSTTTDTIHTTAEATTPSNSGSTKDTTTKDTTTKDTTTKDTTTKDTTKEGTTESGQTKDDQGTTPSNTGSSEHTTTIDTSKEGTTQEKTSTTKTTTSKATHPPPPPTTTCKSESCNKTGLIVALVLFVILLVVAIGMAGFLFFKIRGLQAELGSRPPAAQRQPEESGDKAPGPGGA